MAILIKADGETKKIYPSNGKRFSLEEMQSCVGGNIEFADTHDKRFKMIINEDGISYNLPMNFWATNMYPHNKLNSIYGDVLVVKKEGERIF